MDRSRMRLYGLEKNRMPYNERFKNLLAFIICSFFVTCVFCNHLATYNFHLSSALVLFSFLGVSSAYPYPLHPRSLASTQFRGHLVSRGRSRPHVYLRNQTSRPPCAHPVGPRIFSQSRPLAFRPSRFNANRRRVTAKKKPRLDPTDPLNLNGLIKEADRRRSQGLSPLHGDSRLNTPVLKTSGDSDAPSQNVDISNIDVVGSRLHRSGRGRFYPRGSRNYRRQGRRLPLTGNYHNYYYRRDPDSRMEILIFQWFIGSDVADYGCHNGTFTFKILEKFPDVGRIDAFDCDAELIENARNMQKEKMRWRNKGDISYEKISFQVADWCESMTAVDDPIYDTILAFSVTKWIHLNYGDDGIHRFFRRVFNLLKPGGRLLLEPQPKSSYRRSRITDKQRENFRSMKLDPSEFRDVLLAIGFSYFEDLKIPQRGEKFQRTIMMCSKSVGDTPYNIRNEHRESARLYRVPSPPVDVESSPLRPPPVIYNPYNTPNYPIYSPFDAPDFFPENPSPILDIHQEDLITSTVAPAAADDSPSETTLLASQRVRNPLELVPNVPDSTSQP